MPFSLLRLMTDTSEPVFMGLLRIVNIISNNLDYGLQKQMYIHTYGELCPNTFMCPPQGIITNEY